MIFSSPVYFLFFIFVLIVLHKLKQNHHKKIFLLISSYYFYAYWDHRFVLLMLIMSVVNYFFGKKIELTNLDDRKHFLKYGIIFNLCILGVFKYYNFFIESCNILLLQMKINFPYVDIVLPVGISFITFEVISYLVDIYRRTNVSAKSFLDLALLVAFFPHLIAGPILKPMYFFPQLDKPILILKVNLEIGLQIFILGLIKKVLIADRLALFVDPVFKNPEFYSMATVWLAVIAYALQIYCDFSGYTDMAIGSARCMGFDIPQNFNMPYLSQNITEFWRRWHISLSMWLRDYLYIPLGGNRKGKLRTYINLILVMLLGGLWHGASWNFVTWGGIHGIGLAVHRGYRQLVEHSEEHGNLVKVLSWMGTFLFVAIAWIFFRSSDFGLSWIILKKMFCVLPTEGVQWYATSLWLIIPIIVLAHIVRRKIGTYYFSLTSCKGLFALFFILLGILFLMPVNSSPFIYFQF